MDLKKLYIAYDCLMKKLKICIKNNSLLYMFLPFVRKMFEEYVDLEFI